MLLTRPKLLTCEANAGELPARFSGEKISVRGPNMGGRGNTRSSAQNKLAAHKFSVIFSERAGQGAKAGIAEISARVPLPTVSKQLRRTLERRRGRGEHGDRSVWAGSLLAGGFGRGRRNEATAVEQIAVNQMAFGGGFPFRFRSQPTACPARVRIGLVIAHVTHGCVLHSRQRLFAAQSEEAPVAAVAAPVEGRAPAVVIDRHPSLGEPELDAPIATVGHELGIFAASDQPVGK